MHLGLDVLYDFHHTRGFQSLKDSHLGWWVEQNYQPLTTTSDDVIISYLRYNKLSTFSMINEPTNKTLLTLDSSDSPVSARDIVSESFTIWLYSVCIAVSLFSFILHWCLNALKRFLDSQTCWSNFAIASWKDFFFQNTKIIFQSNSKFKLLQSELMK